MARPKARFIVRDGDLIKYQKPCSMYVAHKKVADWVEHAESLGYVVIWHTTGYGADIQMSRMPRTVEAVPA